MGEQVLVLLPSPASKLKAQWQGPYTVTRQVSDTDYEVDTGKSRKRLRVYHVNLLRQWRDRDEMCMHIQSDTLYGDTNDWMPPTGTETYRDISVSETLTTEQRTPLLTLLQAHEELFTDQPSRTTLVEHTVDVADAQPIRLPAYRLPQTSVQVVREELDKMLESGVIEPSNSPWAAPIVLVKKKDGGVRFCVDYRRLNAVTRFDAFPLPIIEEIIDDLGNAAFISTLDLTKGYWQIPLTPDARDKTAFITPMGTFQFTVMPFGLKNAPATFQRMIQGILAGTELFARGYIDDIVIHSNTWEEHLEHLTEIFGRLHDANLSVRPSKCSIGNAQVNFLGHVVGTGHVRPMLSKVEAVDNFPEPITKKQVRSFLGLCGYYRKFISNFSTIAFALTKKGRPSKIVWSTECDVAFTQLKEALKESPVLTSPDYSKPFLVQVDASEVGIGVVLCQVDANGDEHPVVYGSRKLIERERKLSTPELECLGIVWTVEWLRPYLYGRKFTLQTDHNPLVWLNRVKDRNQKLLRWSMILQEYDLDIRYKKGKEHTNADALSRC